MAKASRYFRPARSARAWLRINQCAESKGDRLLEERPTQVCSASTLLRHRTAAQLTLWQRRSKLCGEQISLVPSLAQGGLVNRNELVDAVSSKTDMKKSE